MAPRMEIGDKVRCYNNEEYEVIEISNDYEEIAKYDSTGACQEFVDEMNLAEDTFDDENCKWFVAVKHLERGDNYVFGVSHDSEILGE